MTRTIKKVTDMKKNFTCVALAIGICGLGTFANAEKTYISRQDPEALACVQAKVRLAEPKVVKTGKNRAEIKAKLTNGMSYPLRTVYLRYTVNSRETGQVIVTDPVSLTVPAIAPGTTSEIETPFFGLPVSANAVAVGLVVEDVADPSGDQIVKNTDIIGLGWTGRKSKMGCN